MKKYFLEFKQILNCQPNKSQVYLGFEYSYLFDLCAIYITNHKKPVTLIADSEESCRQLFVRLDKEICKDILYCNSRINTDDRDENLNISLKTCTLVLIGLEIKSIEYFVKFQDDIQSIYLITPGIWYGALDGECMNIRWIFGQLFNIHKIERVLRNEGFVEINKFGVRDFKSLVFGKLAGFLVNINRQDLADRIYAFIKYKPIYKGKRLGGGTLKLFCARKLSVG